MTNDTYVENIDCVTDHDVGQLFYPASLRQDYPGEACLRQRMALGRELAGGDGR